MEPLPIIIEGVTRELRNLVINRYYRLPNDEIFEEIRQFARNEKSPLSEVYLKIDESTDRYEWAQLVIDIPVIDMKEYLKRYLDLLKKTKNKTR